MKNRYALKWWISTFVVTFFVMMSHAQSGLPECESIVPFFPLNMTSDPDSIYTTPEVVRQPLCCDGGGSGNQSYISFFAELHPDAVMVEIGIAPGYADPGGSGNYNQILGGDLTTAGDCQLDINGGESVCLQGTSPYKFVYHKPGGNKVAYYFKQVPRPIFPVDQATRYGCSLPLEIYGLNNISIVAIATTGSADLPTCDSYMNKTIIDKPIFTPGSNSSYPYTITYRICGLPQAAACGTYQPCQDVVLTVYPPLSVTVPASEFICSSGADAEVTADPEGGDGNYSYYWVNNLDTVEYLQTLTTGIAGSYTIYLEDGLTSPTCPAEEATTTIYVADPTVANAGPDQNLCASDGSVQLNGSYDSNSSAHYWSGGDGTFSDINNALATYFPSPTEISSGADVVLTFTAEGMGACSDNSDQVTISISSPLIITGTPTDIACYGGTSTIDISVSGGRPDPDYFYSWTTGETSQDESVSAGTYILTVTDSYACTESNTYTITQPSPIVLNLSNVDEVSGCDGEVHVSISGGTGLYSIVWKDALNNIVGTNINDVYSLCSGIYTVTVTDANGCVISSSTVVNTAACSNFDITLGQTDVDCYGNSTGSASVTSISGGVGPLYSFSWSNGENTQNITNLPAGVYTVTVSDLGTSPNCIEVASILVLEPTVLTNTMTSTNLTSATPPSNDGTATANPMGGTPGIPAYTYSWSPGVHPATQTINNLSVGLYEVTITDNNDCFITDQVFINQPPCSDFLIAVNHTDVSCNGDDDGTASLFIANGTPNYSIVWSALPGSNNLPAYNDLESIQDLQAGSYSVEVTDGTGCYTIKNFTITEPAELNLGIAQTNVSCHGMTMPNGTIDLTVSGGTFPFNYSWYQSNRLISNSQDLISLGAGTYTVIVTDANGCSATTSIGIQEPAAINAQFIQTDNPCYGQNVGSINTTASGGIAPYTYSWTSPSGYSSSNEDLANLYAGLYELSITDQNNCEVGPLQVYINQSQALVAVASMATQVTCEGGNDGSASLTVTGGVSPYSYSWSGPGYTSSIEDPTGMPAGTFTVLVTDAYSCTTTTSVDITTVIDITNPTITCPSNVSVPADLGVCFATVASLGTPITADNCLVFSITNNAPTSYPFGSTIVTWTVLDGLGNSASCDQTVNVFDNQNPTISCPPNVIDYADPDVCTAALSGVDLGTPVTADNCSVASVTNNAPTTFVLGNNTVTWIVIDASGLTATCNQTVTILDDQDPTITCPDPVNVSTGTNNCIATGVSLGAPITDDNCSVLSVTNNAPSVYNLGATTVTWTVTDGSNNTSTCTQVVTVTDIIPPVIICPGTVTVNADAGVCTTASVSLGTPGTTDNCSVATVVNNAPSPFPLGTTIVTWTVTDGSGNSASCPQTVVVNDIQDPTITCPDAVSVTADAGLCGATGVDLGIPVTNDNCSVALVSNNAPATFPLGTTTVTWIVTDGSGNTAECTQLVTVTDDEDPGIIDCPVDFLVNNDNGDCGAIVTWIPPTFTDNCGAVMTYSHEPGTYFEVGSTEVTYTVTDGSGNISTCTFEVTVEDTENPSLTCPSTIETCDPIVEFNSPIAADNCQVLTVIQTAGLESGDTYSVGTTINTYSVTDNHGNTSTCSFEVVVFPVPVISLDVTNVSCNGFGDGEIDATISVGTAPYIYDWTNGEETEDLTSLTPGTYSLTVIDENGCTDNSEAIISQPETLTLQAIVDNVNCFNGSDGSIDISVIGGTTPYNFNWNNGSMSEDLSGLEMGSYDVTITDANACEVIYATTITHPDSLMITGTPYAANCGSATGLISVNVTGGTTPYSFDWTDGSTGMSIYNVAPGVYSLEVIDAQGCTNTFTDTIKSTSDLSAALTVKDASCYGEHNGEISANVSSGYAPFTYVWSNGQSLSTATELSAGNYSVTITDFFGCVVTLSADVDQPDSLYVLLSNSVYSGGNNISQYGGDDGYINSTVYGGVSPYDYSWFGPDNYTSNQQNISNLIPGAYLLTVTDANGCQAITSSRLTQPDILEMPNGFSPNGDKDNEYFEVHGIDAYPDNTIQVFNRWGNLVYEMDGYNNEWNGDNMNGEPLPDATYFVVLVVRVNGEDLEPLTGYVDLRR